MSIWKKPIEELPEDDNAIFIIDKEDYVYSAYIWKAKNR